MSSISSASSTGTGVQIRSYLYYRHTLAVRLMHWINVIALTVLFLSGLNIFSAHPALYWGKSSYTERGPVFEITAQESDAGAIGLTQLLGHEWVTTGVMGASAGPDGDVVERTFPSWLTIPGNRWLSMARRWHFFFAWLFVINGLCYLAYSIASRHFARDLALTATDWRSIGRSVADHLRVRHPNGEAAKRCNVLQKLAYLSVIFVLLPLIVLMGFAMSPWLDSITGLGRLFRWSPVSEDHPLHRRVASGRLSPHPRVRGDHQRFLESPALDGHWALSHQPGDFQ